ncbi:MAG: LacI family DNA-binding transcriptional regulator [Anaerolineae bacterium]
MVDPKANSSPTIKEVAKAAGVSTATVSRVMNGADGVSSKLEKKVHAAMEKLHYHPSTIARSFKKQETRLIGVMLPLLDHPFYSRMATAIEKKLFTSNYRAIICNSEESEEREQAYIEMLLRQRVDGIIINSAAKNTAYMQELQNLKIPYVLIDRILPEIECDKVFCDNSNGGYLGMQHLIQLGHRHIAVVAAPTFTEPIIRRIRGTREALADFGIQDDPNLLVTGDTQLFDMGYEAACHLLDMNPRPTAIFALTDVTAVGVMHAVAERGLKIPDDLSVLGYDDVPVASYTIPPLTTVAQPIVEMGEEAVDLLFRQIENPHLPNEKAVLQPHLVIRSSTAPPANRNHD